MIKEKWNNIKEYIKENELSVITFVILVIWILLIVDTTDLFFWVVNSSIIDDSTKLTNLTLLIGIIIFVFSRIERIFYKNMEVRYYAGRREERRREERRREERRREERRSGERGKKVKKR